MKKELQRMEGEQLWQWQERLAKAYAGRAMKFNEINELLHDVSVEGYITGLNAMKKYGDD
jgi:hypothetical protein